MWGPLPSEEGTTQNVLRILRLQGLRFGVEGFGLWAWVFGFRAEGSGLEA